jgi:hypothetical protein
VKNPRRIRRRHSQHQKKQILKDGWADYEGEVSRYEDRYLEENVIEEVKEDIIEAPSSKSTSLTKQVWIQKAIIISGTPAQEEAQLESLEKPSKVTEES